MIAGLAVLAQSACGASGRTPAPAQQVDRISGRVRVVGATPFERVVIEPLDSAEAAVEIRGVYRDELRRLGGATVQAVGTLSSSGQMLVQEYEILEIAGHVPRVGTLEVAGDRIMLRAKGGVTVEAAKAPAELFRHSGAKVWVILDSTGAVTGYGIIRER